MSGGRLKRVFPYLDKNEVFCFTYGDGRWAMGDGLSDINIRALINYHRQHNTLATLTAV